MLWDIFCKVIDNHGDVGVCWRLSSQLAARGEQVRLWLDDASALRWMAPTGNSGVQVLPWDSQSSPSHEPGDVVIEAFGCELEQSFQASIAAKTRKEGPQPLWINLEYLTAELFGERNHRLPSPVLTGSAAGLVKHFFYPGFTPETGGLLREHDLVTRQAQFDRDRWLRRHGVDPRAGRLVSLFCYEPPALGQLLEHWAAGPDRTELLVTAGRASAVVREVVESNDQASPSWNRASRLSISYLPLLSQPDFDHLLWACDLNFVRGEDSLVRALWAGKPLVWQIYPQHDDAHHAKLRAFLDWLNAPADMSEFHSAWNGITRHLPSCNLEGWTSCVQRARERLLAQRDLITQLMCFGKLHAQASR
jgi:uncharacterized repeat protein (TIGR03837 family)